MSVSHAAQTGEPLEFEGLGLACPTCVAAALSPVLDQRGLVLVEARGSVLRRERPALARYAVTARGQGGRVELAVIGKGVRRHSSPADLERVFELMRALWEGGFGRDPRLTIAEPLALVADPPTLLQAEVPGETLEPWLDNPLPAMGSVRLAGRWLAKLHDFDTGSLRAVGSVDEESKLLACAERISRLCPTQAERPYLLARRLSSLLGELRQQACVLTHGDFQAGNIIVSGRRLAGIDFDHAALAPAARDLGYFAAQALTRIYARTGSMTAGWPWGAALRDEYLEHRPGGDRGFSTYLARTILEVLYYQLGKTPDAAMPRVPAWLDWCEDALVLAERDQR